MSEGAHWSGLNSRVYTSTQKLITHLLVNRGYKRYEVVLKNPAGRELRATVWAQDPKRMEELYRGRGMQVESVLPLSIAHFKAQQFPDGTMVGDVIVLDEGEMQ